MNKIYGIFVELCMTTDPYKLPVFTNSKVELKNFDIVRGINGLSR